MLRSVGTREVQTKKFKKRGFNHGGDRLGFKTKGIPIGFFDWEHL